MGFCLICIIDQICSLVKEERKHGARRSGRSVLSAMRDDWNYWEQNAVIIT